MQPLPDYGDLMSVEDFVACVKGGMFVPDDGIGYFATETEYDEKSCVWDKQNAPSWATNVIWFNK